MRPLWSLLALAFVARAFAEGLPLYLSGGAGTLSSGADQSVIFVSSASLMTADFDRGTRVELCVGGWYLRQRFPLHPGIGPGDDGCTVGDYLITESYAIYQAAKASGRTRMQPGHFPLLEVGLGLGVHEEWQGSEQLDVVPRIHVSTRFCLLPSRPTSPLIELEVMPRLRYKSNLGLGTLYWAKAGYAFRI